MFSKLAGKVAARRAAEGRTMHAGDFEIEYLTSDHQSFDLGVHYRSCDHCDFRMTKDGPTRITSKTPEVQRVVELISAQERSEES
jgi:hypothetical protein